ncbi:MAG: DUF1573 domain-containing protein [Patescibacteria group bacterium]
MKRIFFLAFALIVVSLLVFGYFKAIPDSDDQNQPKIIITPDSFDFGEIEYGQVAKYTFKVKNMGKEALEINKIATSCGCTTGKVSKEIVNPNEEVELLVKYDTGAMSGPHGKGKQERIIYVKSNDPSNPQAEVMIHAYVK